MKKLLSIVIFCVLSFTALTATAETLIVNAHIDPTYPVYHLTGSLSQDSGYVSGTLDTDIDISLNDIDVFLKITQSNRARVKGQYLLTVTATALRLDDDNETALPSIIQISKFASVSDFTTSGDGAEITVNYPTGKPFKPYNGQSREGEVAILKATWEAVDTLAPGTYSSNVVFTYSAL